MDKGNIANVLKQAELGLFRVNNQLKESIALSKEIEKILQSLALSEEAASRNKELEKEFEKQMHERKISEQSHALSKQLDMLRKNLQGLVPLEQKTTMFLEKFRTGRLYQFHDSKSALAFAKQILELFSIQRILFKPRFVGAINLEDITKELKLEKSGQALVLKPSQLKPLVNHLIAKKFTSNISLEASGIKLIWMDKKTIGLQAPAENLFRTDRLCDALSGKCIEH